MKYQVTLFYKDQKSLNLMIKKSEIARFFEDLTSSQVYRNPDSESGFWTNLNDIRYILINEKEDIGVEVIKNRISAENIHGHERGDSEKEKDS